MRKACQCYQHRQAPRHNHQLQWIFLMYKENLDRASGELHQPVDPGFDDWVKRMESPEGQRWINEWCDRLDGTAEMNLGGAQEWRNTQHG